MANLYAGILGLIAFLVVVSKSIIDGGGIEGTMKAGCVALAVFTILGFLAGKTATMVVDESVRMQLREEWDEIRRMDEEDKKSAPESQPVREG